MITNLFSIFDPSNNSIFSINWISFSLTTIILTRRFWAVNSYFPLITKNLFAIIEKEFTVILGIKINTGITKIMISIFLFILVNNFIGIFPYIFNITSHMRTNIRISLPLWVAIISFGFINYAKYILAHLVPQGTPGALISFMVLIEVIRNIIRPGTLAIRLTANIIAGHLLIALLGNQFVAAQLSSFIPIYLTQIALTTLELAVSVIQSYVFAVLIALYLRESANH